MAKVAHASGFSAFSVLVWTAFLAVAIYLLAWPPIEGMVVVRTWKKVPCYLSQKAAGNQIYFEYGGVRYYSTRLNLWIVRNSAPVMATQDLMFLEPNAQCYVRDAEGKPGMAVLDPQAGPGVLIFDRLGIVGLVLAAAGLLDFQARRAARKARLAKLAPPGAGVSP